MTLLELYRVWIVLGVDFAIAVLLLTWFARDDLAAWLRRK